jgi:hypothetical protein
MEREVFIHDHCTVLRNHNVFTEAAEKGELIHVNSFWIPDLVNPPLEMAGQQIRSPVAELPETRNAGRTTAARRHPGENDMVSDLDPFAVVAHALDNARSLVPENGGELHGVVSRDGVVVRVADTARNHADSDLIRPRFIPFQFLDDKRLTITIKDCTFCDRHKILLDRLKALNPTLLIARRFVNRFGITA